MCVCVYTLYRSPLYHHYYRLDVDLPFIIVIIIVRMLISSLLLSLLRSDVDVLTTVSSDSSSDGFVLGLYCPVSRRGSPQQKEVFRKRESLFHDSTVDRAHLLVNSS